MKLAWQQIPSTVISEILCLNDMDGVVLDTEHGCFNNETLYACIQVITLKGKKCFLRLTDVDKKSIRYCLDAGATGVIFSTIEREEQVLDVIKHCYYPKEFLTSARGLGLVRENNWGEDDLAAARPIVIAQIETTQGVRLLNSIDHTAFDYFLIGPYDLSASLWCAGDFDNPEFKKEIKRIEQRIPKEKLGIHIPRDVDQHIDKYRDFGLIALGMDTMAILDFHKELDKL